MVLQLDPATTQSVVQLVHKTMNEVNPTTLAGYGLAVVVLLVTNYIFYKQAKDWQKSYDDLSKSVNDYQKEHTAVLVWLQTRLDDQQSLVGTINKMQQSIENLISNHGSTRNNSK